MIAASARTDVPHRAKFLKRSRAFVGYLACALVGCMPSLVSAHFHGRVVTYELSELERHKHSELPADFRTVLFDLEIINESDRPEDLTVLYNKGERAALYIARRSECPKESHCLTGVYYRTILTFDQKALEESWPKTGWFPRPSLDYWHPQIEPLAASYAFYSKCKAAQSVKSSSRWHINKLLLVIECLTRTDALEVTHGIWLAPRGPEMLKEKEFVEP